MCALAPSLPYAEDGLRLPEPQTRACFINLGRNMSPTSLELEIGRVALAGFNVIVFPVYNNGWTFFPSDAVHDMGMPRINPLFKRWDPLAYASQLAQAHGLSIWGFARPFDFHPRHSVFEHRLLRKFPQWRTRVHPLYQSPENKRREMWHPSPLNHEYQRYVADLMAELVVSYPVEALVISYMGYCIHGGTMEQAPFCFSATSRATYAEETGRDLNDDALDQNLNLVRKWQFEKTREQLLYLRHRLLRQRRTVRLICRALPDWRHDGNHLNKDTRAFIPIDWPTHLLSADIDELAIDPDGEKAGPMLGARLAADYAYLGDRVLSLPVLSVHDPIDLAPAIKAIERYPTAGFIAEFESSLSDNDVAFLQSHVFTEPATPPEMTPVVTAINLLDRVRRTHEDRAVLHDLITDFLRLLTRQVPIAKDFSTLQMIENNIHGLEQFIRRGRLGLPPIPETTMRNLGLARRFVRMASMDVRS